MIQTAITSSAKAANAPHLEQAHRHRQAINRYSADCNDLRGLGLYAAPYAIGFVRRYKSGVFALFQTRGREQAMPVHHDITTVNGDGTRSAPRSGYLQRGELSHRKPV